MKKKQIIILLCCMVFGVASLYSLYALSPFAADIPRETFNRNFDAFISVAEQGQLNLGVNSFYIAGTAKNTVYLGNYSGPYHLLQVNIATLDTLHLNVSIDKTKVPDDFRLFRMKVDSPFFYLSHGTMPGIFKGSLTSRRAISFSPNGAPFFSDAIPVSSGRLALKSFDRETNENELAAMTLDSPYFEFKPSLLEKQIDGIFCVDGYLHYNKDIHKIVYVYAYRNEYLVMDTLLNSVDRFHTIDSFYRAPIRVADITSKEYRTLANPPSRVNKQISISQNLLFIESPLLANNEDKLEFQKGSTIDVYDIEQGKYLYSFHLGNKYEHRPSSFAVVSGKLVAIFDHHLVMYDLDLPIRSSPSLQQPPQ